MAMPRAVSMYQLLIPLKIKVIILVRGMALETSSLLYLRRRISLLRCT